VLICGFDIIFFWVARMTMMAGYFTKQMPFKDVYIHGLVRDENNQKMSKTKNNGIDPLVLIDKYGTDALRYALINEVVGAGQDIRLDYNRKTDESSTVESARNFANKLWNASRFVLMNLGDNRPELPAENELELGDRWILSRFNQTAKYVNEQLPNYGLGEAARALYGFIWNEFCDYYIELVKPRLQSEEGRSQTVAQGVLLHVLKGTLALLHPYMPHLTEEIWSAVANESEQPLAIQAYPETAEKYIDEAIDAQFNSIFEAIRVIRNLRAELEIKPSQKIKAVLQGESTELQPLSDGESYIKHLARVEELVIVETVPPDLGQTMAGVVGTVQVLVPLTGVVDIAQLQQRLEKNLGKLNGNIASLEGRLSNEGYVKKAPAHIVEGARVELEEAKQQAQILKGRLEQLQKMN
jgi:valyl-tRNA synthetase